MLPKFRNGDTRTMAGSMLQCATLAHSPGHTCCTDRLRRILRAGNGLVRQRRHQSIKIRKTARAHNGRVRASRSQKPLAPRRVAPRLPATACTCGECEQEACFAIIRASLSVVRGAPDVVAQVNTLPRAVWAHMRCCLAECSF